MLSFFRFTQQPISHSEPTSPKWASLSVSDFLAPSTGGASTITTKKPLPSEVADHPLDRLFSAAPAVIDSKKVKVIENVAVKKIS